MSLQIISDSASDLTPEEAKEFGVTVLPLKTLIDGEIYRDGVDITKEEFFEKLETAKELPKTSQLLPYEYEEILEPIIEKGDEAIIITLGSSFSGTYQNALAAAEKYGDKVHVIDSEMVTLGQQLLVRLALELKEKGLSTKEIVEELEKQKNRIHIVASIDTLEYLIKGGRLSKVSGIAGTLFKIKPVIDVSDGEIKILSKPRGKKRSAEKITEVIKDLGGIDYDLPVMIGYTGNDPSVLDHFVEHSDEIWEGHLEEIPRSYIGSTIGTHSGPGCYGATFFVKE